MPPTAARAPSSTVRFGPVEVEFDERVLTPRPWTLVQSEWAAESAAQCPPGPLLELCAGAGHIGLAAAVLSGRRLVQVEADPVAAGYARANAARAGRADLVDVRTEPMATALRPGERFPVMLADPPYLRSTDTARWPADPLTAIDGGPDGLAVIRSALAVASAHLLSGGQLLLQVAGPRQAVEVSALLPRAGLVRRALRAVDAERAVLLAVRR